MNLHRSWTRLTVGLLATAAIGTAYHLVAQAEATHRVEAALARLPNLRAASVSVDPWTGRVVLSRLVGRAGEASVSIGKVAFRGMPSALPRIVGPAYAADGEASAEDIEIEAGASKIHIPKIEMTGTSLTDGSLKAIFDPKSAATLSERILKFSADEVSIPELTIDTTTPGAVQKLTYEDIELEHVAQGKIGAYSSGEGVLTIRFTEQAAQLGTVEATIGDSKATNVDIGLYARIMTQGRKDANEPLQQVYDSFESDGFDVKGKSFTLKTGPVTSGRFAMRPFTVAPSEMQKLGAKPGTPPTPEQAQQAMAAVADIYYSMDFDKLEIKDVAGTFGEGKRGSFKLASARFGQFARARIGEMAFDGFDLTAPRTQVKFDAFALRDFDFKSSIDMMKTMPMGNPAAMRNINPRAFIPSLGQIRVSGLEANVPAAKRDGNADGGASNKFKISGVDIRASNYLLGIPGTLSIAVDHLMADLPAPKDPQSRQLAEMGYTRVDVSSKFAYTWTEAANKLTLTDASVDAAGMFAASLKAAFGNVTRDLFVGDTALMQAALLGAVVTSADLRVENHGLLDKLFGAQAKQAGITAEQLQQGLASNARANIAQLFGDSSQANAIADAVTTFLKTPKSVQIVAKSAKGFGAADLPLIQNPGELLKRLDIQATANR